MQHCGAGRSMPRNNGRTWKPSTTGDTVTDFTLPEETSFLDVAMVHLLTTATLDRLRELYPQGRFEVRRFRPNIVVQLGSN